MARATRLDDDDLSAEGRAAARAARLSAEARNIAREPTRPLRDGARPVGPRPPAPPPGGGGSRGFRTVLRNKYFLRLWVAQLISQTIMNASNYGLIVLVATQGSNLQATRTSGAIVAFSLPAALFGAPAGVIVDRFNRRTVLWVSNVLRGLASVGFVISLFVDQTALIPVLLLSFFTAMVGQFFAPAEGATIPLLVHSDELISALSLFNITFTLAQALGLIILGPAVLLFVPVITLGTASHGIQVQPIETLFILVVLLYGVCSLLIVSIPKERFRFERLSVLAATHTTRSRQLRGLWAGMVESWRYVRRDGRLSHAVLQLCLGGTVVAIIATIAPSFVGVFFNLDPSHAALVFIPAGAGLVLGSALTPLLVRRLRYSRTVAVGVIALAVCAAALTLARAVAMTVQRDQWWTAPAYLTLALAVMFLIGIALDLVNIPAQTELQERAPDWIKGRVLALQGMLLNALTVPSVLIMGLAADVFGLPAAMDALAVAIAIIGLASVYLSGKIGNDTDGEAASRPL